MEKNKITLSKRAFVRIVSYLTAIAAVFAIMAAVNQTRADTVETRLEYGYMRAMGDLSLSIDNIKTTLNKGLYSNSPSMMTELSSRLRSEASTAKVALSQLPVSELDLEAVYKFLSQVGNYSLSLAEKYTEGDELTGNERENLRTLYTCAQSLSDSMWQAQELIGQGVMSFSSVSGNEETATLNVTEGFTEFEEGFPDYPTLIYDGPFSDHILERTPLMTAGKAEILQEEALKKAISVSSLDGLSPSGDEGGKMPCYVFEGDGAAVAVTKNGGFFCYMIKYRPVSEKAITSQAAIEAARAYMSELGIDNVTDTYYEINNGVCIVNFAGVQDGVTLYTDLIKVGVALDNGEILSFDARGYITNHSVRSLEKPLVSATQARSRLSDELEVEDSKLCVIPSDGLEERFCYEFLCSDSNGRRVLVYLNANTGEEENILLLEISSNGRLTV